LSRRRRHYRRAEEADAEAEDDDRSSSSRRRLERTAAGGGRGAGEGEDVRTPNRKPVFDDDGDDQGEKQEEEEEEESGSPSAPEKKPAKTTTGGGGGGGGGSSGSSSSAVQLLESRLVALETETARLVRKTTRQAKRINVLRDDVTKTNARARTPTRCFAPDGNDLKRAVDLYTTNSDVRTPEQSYELHQLTGGLDIADWCVDYVQDFSHLFDGTSRSSSSCGCEGFCSCSFESIDLSRWNTENALTMESMFGGQTLVNVEIGSWDVRNVVNFQDMFHYAVSFDRDLSAWEPVSAENMESMFSEAGMYAAGKLQRVLFSRSFGRDEIPNELGFCTIFSLLYFLSPFSSHLQ